MVADKVETLVECLKKKCETDKTAISLVNEMNKFEKKIAAGAKITNADVDELRALADKVDKHDVKISDTQCMVTKCVDEYVDLMKSNLKVTAERMRALADRIKALIDSAESIAAPRPKSSKPKSRSVKPQSKSKSKSKSMSMSKTGSAKPKSKYGSKQ